MLVSPRGRKDAIELLQQQYTLNFTGINPSVTTEVGFCQQVDSVADLLKDVKGPWKDRIDAIKKLQSLVLGGAGKLLNFRELVHERLQHGLVAQVGDLRSQVVKEACHLLMMMAKMTPPNVWEEMSGWFIPALQKQVPVSVLAISQVANACLRFFVEHNRISQAGFKCLIDGTRFKNNKTRVRSFEHLFLLIHQMPLDHLSPTNYDLLCSAAVQGMADADQSVRQLARLVFCGLETVSQKGAADMWKRMSDAQRRQTNDEKLNYAAIDPTVLLPRQNSYAVMAEAPHHHHHHQQQQQPQDHQPQTKRRSTSSTRPGALQPVSGNTPTPKAASRKPWQVKRKTHVGGGGGAGGVSTASCPSAQQDNSQTEFFVPQKRPATRVHHHHQQQLVVEDLTVDNPHQPHHVLHAPQDPIAPNTVARLLDELIDGPALHQHPEVKIDAYAKLGEHVLDTSMETQPAAGRVMQKISARLAEEEGNFRVVQEMLTCLQKAAKAHPRETQPILEKLLASVFGAMSEKKGTVKEKARNVVDTIMAANTVGTMFITLLKVLETNIPSVRASCLECFLYILRFCSEYLSCSKNMKQGLLKILKALTLPASTEGEGKEIERLAVASLQLMSKLQSRVFLSEASCLPNQRKRELLELAGEAVPSLQEINFSVHHNAPTPPTPSVAAADIHLQQQQKQQQDVIRIWSHTDPSEMKQAALKQLLQWRQRRAQWQLHFHDFIGPVLHAVRDADFQTRSLAIGVVQMVLDSMPGEAADVLPDILAALFRGADDTQSDVSTRAREALCMTSRLSPEAIIAALLEALPSASDRCTQVALAGILPNVLSNLPSGGVAEYLPFLRTLVHSSITSPSTDLRKAATWCLVDLYMAAPETAKKLAKGLPPAKIRLLDFYISRRGASVDLTSELA